MPKLPGTMYTDTILCSTRLLDHVNVQGRQSRAGSRQTCRSCTTAALQQMALLQMKVRQITP